MKYSQVPIGSGLFANFEGQAGEAAPEFTSLATNPLAEIVQITCLRRKPLDFRVTSPEGRVSFLVSVAGHVLVRELSMLAPPESIALIGPSAEISMSIGRGAFSAVAISLTEGLSRELAIAKGELRVAQLGADKSHVHVASLLHELTDPATPPARVVGFLIALTAHKQLPARADITHVRKGFPKALEALTEAVRQNPAGHWGLKDASNQVGYSPFHLSRTFRQIAGFGFPEYVDRCRTSLALNMLLNDSDASIDQAAISSGFGSTQAMRDSFREYLGFLPSEIRGSG